MREQSSNLQREDRKAYAEQVSFFFSLSLLSIQLYFLNSQILSPQVALAFYKAIGGGSDDEDDPI